MNSTPAVNKEEVSSLLEEAYAIRINNLKKSIELSESALLASRKMADKALIGKSLSQLSLFYMIMGEYKSSMTMSEEAIGHFTQLGDEKGIADAKYSIAGIYYKTDNYHLGLVNLIDCLAIYRKFNDYHNQARVQKSLGTIYEFFGDQMNAVRSYESSIEAARAAGDTNLESNTYNPLSGIYLKQNNIEKALEIIERSIRMKEETGDIRGLAFALYGRGKVYTRQSRFEDAEKDFKKALEIHLEMGERLGVGMTYHKMGALYLETGELDKAKDVLRKGLEFSATYNIVLIKIKCKYLLYKIYKLEGNSIKALEYLELYLEQKESVINTQTLKVIENYELITRMESLEKETRLQKEKAEIMAKKDIAEHAARVKQEFLSTMSHEIRTPLNAVITITSLLKERSDEEDKQLLHALKFASNNLLQIINDILDFTKLDTGKVRIEKRPVHFASTLESIRNTYESLAREKGIGLVLQLDPQVSEAYELDETKISQILGNLISNAIKYTDEGQVEIRIENLGEDEGSDLLRFRIIDTGTGIPPQSIEEIFESFSQPKSVTTRKQGGSGLGLAIVKKLVELHDSDIQVKSVVGQGSEFFFDMKLRRSGLPAKAPSRPSNQLQGKTVLLAEDNVINAMVARKLLHNWGMRTEHARNGIEAIEKSRSMAFDFILMDIHMPEVNGFDATEYIRKHDNPNTKTPIFALTADITSAGREDYVNYFTGFLLKPIEIDKLYETLLNA